ncbi:unnamed protein product [Parnassius apollo]|uniref:(apollo) hypothetical protein n=1 Tax=Parnassius apollo TaxID=110799 RepID=A0A8S3YAW2_PARAO|nr:unnamed protein product [Parnassius apollo]
MAGSHSPYDIERSIPMTTGAFESCMTIPAYNTATYVSGLFYSKTLAILDINTPAVTDTANNKKLFPEIIRLDLRRTKLLANFLL